MKKYMYKLFIIFMMILSVVFSSEQYYYISGNSGYTIKCMNFDNYVFEVALDDSDTNMFKTNEICVKIPVVTSSSSPTPKPI